VRFVFILFLFFISCGGKGDFAWSPVPLGEEKRLGTIVHPPLEYVHKRDHLEFHENETIHYLYRFASSPGLGEEYDFILGQIELDPKTFKPLSPFYIYIDKHRKGLEFGSPFVRDHWGPLAVGEYVLKVVQEGDVLDEIYFKILPLESYVSAEKQLEWEEKGGDEIIHFSR
jgi:hypothetical protein